MFLIGRQKTVYKTSKAVTATIKTNVKIKPKLALVEDSQEFIIYELIKILSIFKCTIFYSC